jgi:iron-sulfur cluster assembly accessory protein
MIQLTDNAAKRITEVMQREDVGGLRLAVQGGGCAGFNYVIKFDKASRPSDQIFERGGAKVFVDPKSLKYLDGLTLDFKADLMQQTFLFENPNAKHACSCGTSFSVT